MIPLYPLQFHPIYKEKVWGGTALREKFGRSLPADNIGESWEVAGHLHGVSITANGPLAGKSLVELMDVYGPELIGKALPSEYLTRFPLLLKFLDANAYLSVQVHPDDEYARVHEQGELGKCEAWYVVAAQPGAEIIYGLQEGVTKRDFLQALEEGTIESLLGRVPVKPGDVFNVPAGLLHALGKGVLAAEIQQNSDAVYRVYDWNRVDEDGNRRELHIEQALDVIDFDMPPPPAVRGLGLTEEGGKRTFLVANKYFVLELLDSTGRMIERPAGERFHLLTGLQGRIKVEWPVDSKKDSLILKPGNSLLVPAAIETYELVGRGRIMRCYVPDMEKNVLKPLLECGYSREMIASSIAGIREHIYDCRV